MSILDIINKIYDNVGIKIRFKDGMYLIYAGELAFGYLSPDNIRQFYTSNYDGEFITSRELITSITITPESTGYSIVVYTVFFEGTHRNGSVHRQLTLHV